MQVNRSITRCPGSRLYSQPYKNAPVLLPMPLLATVFRVWAVLLTFKLKQRPIMSVIGVRIKACALPPQKWSAATSHSGNLLTPIKVRDRMRRRKQGNRA